MSIDATNQFNAIRVDIIEEDISIKVSAGLRGPVGFEYIGEYSAGTKYYHTNVVKYSNALYIGLTTMTGNGVIGELPTNTTYWAPMLSSTGPFDAIASQAEAEAGTDNTKGMTPLRTAEAIATIEALENIDYVDFDTTAAPAHIEGRVHWNDSDKTLDIDTEVDGTAIQVGQEVVIRCTNKTGITITDGSCVYIDGAQGSRPTIDLSDADDGGATAKTIGLVTADIDDNATGYVTVIGLVRDIDTSSFVAGDLLWVSSTAGALVNSLPAHPAHNMRVGYCVYSHATNGIVLVSTEKGEHLANLWEVDISSVVNGDYLVYDSASSTWKNIANLPANADLTLGHTTNNSTATTCTALDTYYILAGTWTEHHSENVTITGADGRFTIATGFDGDYDFHADLSMICSRNNTIVCFSFLKNGAYVTGTPRMRRKIGTSSDVGAGCVSTVFHDLVATDYIQCAVQLITGEGANTAGDSVTIENANMSTTFLRS